MSFLAWIVLGLIAGAIAKAIMPGNDPGGIIVTMIIGIVGAFIGGFLGNTIMGLGINGFTWQSLLLAIVAASIASDHRSPAVLRSTVDEHARWHGRAGIRQSQPAR